MRDIRVFQNTTNRIKSTEKYFNEVKAPLLTMEQEVDLFNRFKKGDQKAKRLIIESNLRFVITVAKQYAAKDNPDILMDMIQEGNLGLIKAVEEFDVTKGFKFISYAVWHIKQRIVLYLGLNKTVRYSANILQDRSVIQKIYDKLEVKLERKPNEQEVFEEYNLSHNDKRTTSFNDIQVRSKIKTFLRETGAVYSLDQHLTDEEKTSFGDLLKDETVLDVEQLEISKFLLDNLKPREKTLLEMTYGLDGEIASLNRPAELFDLTTERVRQINRSSIKKLREFAKTEFGNSKFEEIF